MSLADVSAVLSAASLGAMLFFSAAIAPTVFQALPEAEAGKFLRAFFPRYFLINGEVIGLAAIMALFNGRVLLSLAMAASAALMIAVRFYAIPIINDARDRATAGDEAAKRKFDAWHRGTVIINVIAMIVLAVAIYMLLAPVVIS
ncbi:MAG: DUF4149 domain-containing protein [Pseudomonadota bacterium]